MKKRIIYFVLSFVFVFSAFNFANFAEAEEVNINQMINSTTMPTDEEIMATIKQFNFDKTQEEYLFKETKKKLTEVYEAAQKNLSEGRSTQNIGQKQEKQAVDSVQKTNKKYANHDSLTRRSKGN